MENLVTLEITQSRFVEIAKNEMAIAMIRKMVEEQEFLCKSDIKRIIDAVDDK